MSHAAIIRALCEKHPTAQRAGFAKTIRRITEDPSMRAGVVPDLYVVHNDQKEVVVIEAEVTSHLTPNKIHIYADLWWALDNMFWQIGVVAVDRFGRTREVDIFAAPLLNRARG